MAAGTGADELRLNWSARGLAYLLGKHGIEEPLPITPPGARVELRIVGAEVKEVRLMETHDGSARLNKDPGQDRTERRA